MKITVTGASGGVGAFVARELLEHGHEVRALDIAALPDDLQGRVEMVHADICDAKAMRGAVAGCDAVAHLAAIPNPLEGRDLKLFAPNVLGTQTVLAAAAAEGVSRVVLASSTSAYGLMFATHPAQFEYLPVDESHPLAPQDVYGLSKQLGELTAASYTRRFGMATTCLRLTWVVDFASRPAQWRRDMLGRSHRHRAPELWHFIEIRDAARAFRLALERVESGHHVALVLARDLISDHAPRELIRAHFPHLERFLDGDWDFEKHGFWDTRAAESLFGFVAQHAWRDGLDDGLNHGLDVAGETS